MPEDPGASIKPLPIDTPAAVPEPVEPPSKAPAWIPTLLLHILYPDSRKVGWGWQLSIWSTYGCFFARFDGKPILTADEWFLCQLVAGVLIGGGTIADAWIQTKMGGKPNVPAA